MTPPVRTRVRTPPARTRHESAAPAVKHAGASLATPLARQLQAFATTVLGGVGTAADVVFTLAQSKIHRPGTKAAVAKGAALLRDLRQAAGLTLDDLGRALELDEPSFMGLVEAGKVGLPPELILRLTAVLGRNDPVGFGLQMTRAYNPTMRTALEALAVGQLLVQDGLEREFANIYRSHDAARAFGYRLCRGVVVLRGRLRQRTGLPVPGPARPQRSTSPAQGALRPATPSRCRQAAGHERLLMAATGFPRRSPQADLGRLGHRAEGQLPDAAANSHWRPLAALRGGPLTGSQSARLLLCTAG